MIALLFALAQDPHDWVRARVRDLGSDDYAAREKATEELRALRRALDEALAASADPEVQARARRILEPSFVTVPIKAHSTQSGGGFTVEYGCVPRSGRFYANFSPRPARTVVVDESGATFEATDGFTPPEGFGRPIELRIYR